MDLLLAGFLEYRYRHCNGSDWEPRYGCGLCRGQRDQSKHFYWVASQDDRVDQLAAPRSNQWQRGHFCPPDFRCQLWALSLRCILYCEAWRSIAFRGQGDIPMGHPILDVLDVYYQEDYTLSSFAWCQPIEDSATATKICASGCGAS